MPLFLFYTRKQNILFDPVILMKMAKKMKMTKQFSVRKPKQIQTIGNIHSNVSPFIFTLDNSEVIHI